MYIGCRSRSRAIEAIKDIQKETGATDENLLLIILDLASLKSVREFVQEFTSSTPMSLYSISVVKVTFLAKETRDVLNVTY